MIDPIRTVIAAPLIPNRADMTEAEAIVATDRLLQSIEDSRAIALEIYERRGWAAMGYPTFAAYTEARFGQSRNYIYRLVKAAQIEIEIEPEGRLGSIPEKVIRPLSSLPPGDRKPAYDLAVEIAPDGKPTGPLVAEVVAAVDPVPRMPKPKSSVPRPTKAAPSPALTEVEVAEVVAEAESPSATEPLVPSDEPDNTGMADDDDARREAEREDSPIPAITSDELDDQAWLESLPIRSQLGFSSKRTFDADALAFRRLADARKKFINAASRVLAKAKRDGASNGAYVARIDSWLAIDDPRHWRVCPPFDKGGCNGTGTVPLIGKCNNKSCWGRGYFTTTFTR